MGVSLPCPIVAYSDFESNQDSLLQESVNFADNGATITVGLACSNEEDNEWTRLKFPDNGETVVEGSMAFIWRALKQIISDKNAASDQETIESNFPIVRESKDAECHSPSSDSSVEMLKDLPVLDTTNTHHDAAIKLQKVYRGFRTRRKLADCAILVEQSWWKLLDFAELKQSSISFFDIEKHESAISRWSRAKKRAAKVGKGLSKNSKAKKLALQHWLEAIDPRHRYGHNLHFYYKKWLLSQSTQPFFYWLDIGEGKELNLERCPRSKLQQQCIKYLGPMERKAYEVILKDGKFFRNQTGELLHTSDEKKDKWIFVLSTSKILYVGQKKKGYFQHSSFLSGGATICAGRLVVDHGILKAIWPHSGHYQPTEENFREFQAFLQENNVDLTDVKMSSTEYEEGSPNKQSNGSVGSDLSVEELSDKLIGSEPEDNNDESSTLEKNKLTEQNFIASFEPSKSKHSRSLGKKLTVLEIPKANDMLEESQVESPMIDEQESKDVIVPEELILKRIKSHKGLKSFQLGTQLSCKWTTGAGPRIGCVRDYPFQLQHQALEQLNLSPRCTRRSKSFSSCQSIIESSSEVSSPANSETISILKPTCSGNLVAKQ